MVGIDQEYSEMLTTALNDLSNLAQPFLALGKRRLHSRARFHLIVNSSKTFQNSQTIGGGERRAKAVLSDRIQSNVIFNVSFKH